MAKKASELGQVGALAFDDAVIIGQSTNMKRASLATLQRLIKPSLERVVPSSADFPIFINQGAASLIDVAGYGVVLNAQTASTTTHCKVAGRTVPAGSSWKATFGIRKGWPHWNYHMGGICVASQNTGNLAWKIMALVLDHRSSGGASVKYFTSVTTYSESFNSVRHTYGSAPVFMQVRWDGTNYTFAMSMDGVSFHDYFYIARGASVLGTGGTQANDVIGLFLHPVNESADFPLITDQVGCPHFKID